MLTGPAVNPLFLRKKEQQLAYHSPNPRLTLAVTMQ